MTMAVMAVQVSIRAYKFKEVSVNGTSRAKQAKHQEMANNKAPKRDSVEYSNAQRIATTTDRHEINSPTPSAITKVATALISTTDL